RQWISPALTSRSMWSLAVSAPKRFVMPRSSRVGCWSVECSRAMGTSFDDADDCESSPCGTMRAHTDGRSCAWGPAGADPHALALAACLRAGGRLDRDLAGDDRLADRVELRLQLRVDRTLEVVERCEADAVVLERSDVRLVRELAGCCL